MQIFLFRVHADNGDFLCENILAVRKVGHLNIKTKLFDFEARVMIGWPARVFASQPIKTRALKSNLFAFMLRWTTFLTASIIRYVHCSVYLLATACVVISGISNWFNIFSVLHLVYKSVDWYIDHYSGKYWHWSVTSLTVYQKVQSLLWSDDNFKPLYSSMITYKP